MARPKNGSDHLPLTEAQAEELDRRLAEYLEEFERQALRLGAHVHWATDAAEHNARREIGAELLADRAAKLAQVAVGAARGDGDELAMPRLDFGQHQQHQKEDQDQAGQCAGRDTERAARGGDHRAAAVTRHLGPGVPFHSERCEPAIERGSDVSDQRIDLANGHAEIDLERTTIRSPIDGVVIERNVFVNSVALQNRGYAYMPIF